MQMYDLPDKRGHFGPYGGVYVAETLMTALDELRQQGAPVPHTAATSRLLQVALDQIDRKSVV